jgi:hypothetical protein
MTTWLATTVFSRVQDFSRRLDGGFRVFRPEVTETIDNVLSVLKRAQGEGPNLRMVTVLIRGPPGSGKVGRSGTRSRHSHKPHSH